MPRLSKVSCFLTIDWVAAEANALFFQATTIGTTAASSPACQRRGRLGSTASAVAIPSIATGPSNTRSATARRRMPPVTISGMRATAAMRSANSRKYASRARLLPSRVWPCMAGLS
ncbi:hypothetical protein D9M70_522040 [compost metagenome]